MYKPHTTKIRDLGEMAKNKETLTFTLTISNPVLLEALGHFEKDNNFKSHTDAINTVLTNYFIWSSKKNAFYKEQIDKILLELSKLGGDLSVIKTYLTPKE